MKAKIFFETNIILNLLVLILLAAVMNFIDPYFYIFILDR